jgi:hypothetical protein
MFTKSLKGEYGGIQRVELLVATVITILILGSNVQAQTFNSGSDGSDGALSLTTAGTYTFDPNDVATFGRALDADGDGIYNFTTITIGAGVILNLSATKVTRPLYWLASGAVTIDGRLDLTGQGIGFQRTNSLDQRRIVPMPGSGGYAGGAGGAGNVPAQSGQGPGGGAAGTPSVGPKGGTFTGNRFLVPLVGGSGGGGEFTSSFGHPGGAGGGAIAIISSTSILVSGSGRIIAKGGSSNGLSGGGSGGAIKLVATIIGGNGVLDVTEGSGPGAAGPGQVRIEAFQQQSGFGILPAFQLSMGTPFNTFVPTSSVRVVRVNDVALPPNPSASFVLPDVTITQTQAVTLDVEARNIPTGTIVKLEVFAENATDNTVVNQVVDSTPLAGSSALSTATASFTFPPGFSRGFVRATWTQ